MCKLSATFVFAVIMISCSSQEGKIIMTENEEDSTSLSPRTKSHYSQVYNCPVVVGTHHFGTCEDEKISSFNYLRDSAKISELWTMLDDTCSEEFKVFLIQEIHYDSPESDSTLIQKYFSDTSQVEFVSSCFGIPFKQTLGTTCKNIVYLNSLTETIEPDPSGIK